MVKLVAGTVIGLIFAFRQSTAVDHVPGSLVFSAAGELKSCCRVITGWNGHLPDSGILPAASVFILELDVICCWAHSVRRRLQILKVSALNGSKLRKSA